MKTDQQDAMLASIDAIRVETALSRFPVHRLAKAGTVCIELREVDEKGETAVRWEVGYHSKYGQPGPLAYKLDTLIVNRRVEGVGRPTPGLVRLGSLNDICRELGLAVSGKNTADIKRALLQNAFAGISAKIRYRSADGSERELDSNFTRYEVHFAGERLSDGRTADAVYLVLGDTYRHILDNALTRPLDFDYLRDLPPASQRWYELVSYRMFGALKHDRPRARLNYAEFCTYAPQTRYTDFDRAKKQMWKVHAPHRKAGYIAGVESEPTTDRDGRPDWTMIYTPGPKAKAEYRAFTGKGGPVVLEIEPPSAWPEPEPTGLEQELVAHGVTRAVAAELVRDYPEGRVRAQIERTDWLRAKRPRKIGDVGAYLVGAIREDYAAPARFEAEAERVARESAGRTEAERESEARVAKARERAERARIKAYWDGLSSARRTAIDAAALAGADPATRAVVEGAARPVVRRMLMVPLRESYLRGLLGLAPAG